MDGLPCGTKHKDAVPKKLVVDGKSERDNQTWEHKRDQV
jgi:hypothetical protein